MTQNSLSLFQIVEPGIYLGLGTLGCVAGAFARRVRASGDSALKLSAAVALAFLFAMGRGYGDPFLILLLSVFSLGAPIALGYGFHARRSAPERRLAWAGLGVSVVVFALFVFWMVASILNLGVGLGLWQ